MRAGQETTTVANARREQRQRSGRWYGVVALALPSAAAVLCVTAARLGQSRADNVLFYFYEESDVGHPGIVNVVTTMGFASVAVLAGLLALVSAAHTAPNLVWMGTAVLFTVLAIDNLLRLHAQIPGGDTVVHVIYWMGLAAVTIAVGRVLRRLRGRFMLLVGLALLAASEAIDTFTRSDDFNYRFHHELSVLEESLACVGAWCCVVAAVGLASVLVTQADVPVGDGTR